MKRLISATLWFYSLWYLGSLITAAFGLPDLLGPVLGLSGGLIVGIDPRHLIWRGAGRAGRAGWSPA